MGGSNNSDIYDALVKISQGREISNWELQDMDEIVNSVKFNSSSPGKSRVKLTFDDNEDYWKLFDLTDDDIWFANAIYSHYDTFEFESEDWVEDDWKQGYVLRSFGPDNIEKVKDILKILSPKNSKLSSDDDFEKASDLILKMFDRQANEIMWSLTSYRNQCKERGAIEMIESETCNMFQNYGIFSLGRCYYSYVTTVSVLLSLYKMIGDTSLTIYEVLEKIGKDMNIGGQWYDYMYEQDCVDFDQESYDRDVERELDKIMDILTDDDEYSDIQLLSTNISKILDKYETDKWYKTPKDPDMSFKIYDINLKDKTILVLTQKQFKGTEKRSFNLENLDDFNTFLYQPELFESKKFGRFK